MPAGPSRLQDKVSIEVPTDDEWQGSCLRATRTRTSETLLEQSSDVWRTVITRRAALASSESGRARRTWRARSGVGGITPLRPRPVLMRAPARTGLSRSSCTLAAPTARGTRAPARAPPSTRTGRTTATHLCETTVSAPSVASSVAGWAVRDGGQGRVPPPPSCA